MKRGTIFKIEDENIIGCLLSIESYTSIIEQLSDEGEIEKIEHTITNVNYIGKLLIPISQKINSINDLKICSFKEFYIAVIDHPAILDKNTVPSLLTIQKVLDAYVSNTELTRKEVLNILNNE